MCIRDSARAMDALAIPRLADAKQAVQVRITFLLRIFYSGVTTCALLRHTAIRRHFLQPRKWSPPKFPTTLPPQDIKNKRSADLAASEQLAPPVDTCEQVAHLRHKADVYNTLKKRGSMMRITREGAETGAARSPRRGHARLHFYACFS